MRVWANSDLQWNGDTLRPLGRESPILQLERDAKYSEMWRVALPSGVRTDMVNRVRARDAARSILLRLLNGQETSAG